MRDDQTRTRLQELQRRLVDGAALVRCDGTRADVTNYRLGRDKPGWNVKGACAKGDLLVDTQGIGRHRLIIAVTPVDSVGRGHIQWNPGEDVPIFPAISWGTVMERARLTRTWAHLDGEHAVSFLEALAACAGSKPQTSVVEGQRQIATCIRRSRALRDAVLDQFAGTCQACGLRPRADFGPVGDRAIDVHHKVPLGTSGMVRTSPEDVSLVCASCHRLLHTENPPLSITAIADRVPRSQSSREVQGRA